MRYNIPEANWLMVLADIIQKAQTDDIIVVSSEAKKELAERAMARMGKDIKIEVKEIHNVSSK